MSRYTEIRQVGKGAFGCAVLVKSKEDGHEYIMKKINVARLKPREREEAENEVKVLQGLRHPQVVRYKESFIEGGNLCIIMEYCAGGDLQKQVVRMKSKGSYFPEQQILDWFVQICLALKHMHDRKIMHRDLKTLNIFLSGDGKIVKVGDFGIARVLNGTMELARTLVGTPYYFSPEICREKPYSNKTDIWSLGVVLYELCSLKCPFDGASMQALIQKIMYGTYAPIPAQYSSDMRDLIRVMLERDPAKRPSINDLLRTPVCAARIAQFMSDTLIRQEFSHTVLHRFSPHREVKEVLRQIDGKPEAKPAPAAANGGPRLSPPAPAAGPPAPPAAQAKVGRPAYVDFVAKANEIKRQLEERAARAAVEVKARQEEQLARMAADRQRKEEDAKARAAKDRRDAEDAERKEKLKEQKLKEQAEQRRRDIYEANGAGAAAASPARPALGQSPSRPALAPSPSKEALLKDAARAAKYGAPAAASPAAAAAPARPASGSPADAEIRRRIYEEQKAAADRNKQKCMEQIVGPPAAAAGRAPERDARDAVLRRREEEKAAQEREHLARLEAERRELYAARKEQRAGAAQEPAAAPAAPAANGANAKEAVLAAKERERREQEEAYRRALEDARRQAHQEKKDAQQRAAGAVAATAPDDEIYPIQEATESDLADMVEDIANLDLDRDPYRDEEAAAAVDAKLPDKFYLNGKTLDFGPAVAQSGFHRVEALRMYLEQQLGDACFRDSYACIKEARDAEDEVASDRKLMKIMGAKIDCACLIHQLIYCEEIMYSM
eukprot:tig00000076_g2373.t1